MQGESARKGCLIAVCLRVCLWHYLLTVDNMPKDSWRQRVVVQWLFFVGGVNCLVNSISVRTEKKKMKKKKRRGDVLTAPIYTFTKTHT